MKKALFLFFAFAFIQVSAQSTYFIGGNIYFDNTKSYNYIDLTPNSNKSDSSRFNITSISSTNRFTFRPMIIKRTRKGNFREFEISNLGFKKSDNSTHLNNSKDSTVLGSNSTFSTLFHVQLSHNYYWNLLKNVSKSASINVILQNSLGFNRQHYVPYSDLAYEYSDNSVRTDLQLFLGGNYIINKKIMISFRSMPLVSSFFHFGRTYFANPITSKNLRKYYYFDGNINYKPQPQNFTISLAYKL